MTKARTAAKPERWLVELTRAGSNANARGVRKWLLRVPPRLWPVVALLAAALVVGTLTVVLVGSRAPGVDHPARWDARVAPFVGIVEQERDLRFDHPVYVDFLTPKQFLSSSAPVDLDTVGEDHATIDATARLMHALGVVPEGMDMYNTSGRLRGSPVTLGSYSPTSQRIRLRGTELTPALQAALVHELTHALQDQHVDIAARMADLDGMPERQSALRALLEGDADRVEKAWRATLNADDQRELEADLVRVQPAAGGASALLAPLMTLITAPKRLGGPLVDVVHAEAGSRGVNDVFLTPPSTQEHLLDPWSMVQDHQGSLAIAPPLLDPGEESFEEGTFGAVSWLVLLASRLGAEQALAAARGWGGDAYVAFQRDGTDCVRISYAADSGADRTRMLTALEAWVMRGQGAAARVTRQGRLLLLESCETDASVTGRDHSHAAMELAVLHTDLTLTLLRRGFDATAARCGADRLLELVPRDHRDGTLSHRGALRRLMHPCLPDGTA